MLTKDGLDSQTKRLEEINKTISDLFGEQIKILENTRKEILELVIENNVLLTNNGEEPYNEDEIGSIKNGTEFDIDRFKRDKKNSENRDFIRRKEERLGTIYNLLDDNERLKKPKETTIPITTAT